MNYQSFLFYQLFMNYIENNTTEYQELAYDIIYPEVLKHEDIFRNSNYNLVCFSEYDCIINYLQNEIKLCQEN